MNDTMIIDPTEHDHPQAPATAPELTPEPAAITELCEGHDVGPSRRETLAEAYERDAMHRRAQRVSLGAPDAWQGRARGRVRIRHMGPRGARTVKRCPSCSADYDRLAWLELPGKVWPEVGLWLRLCPCGTTLSVPMVGHRVRPSPDGQRGVTVAHVLYCVEPALRGQVTALTACGETKNALRFRLAPECEEPTCTKCLLDLR